MSDIHPKGGKLLRAVISMPQCQIDRQVDSLLKMYPHMTREQAELGLSKEGREVYVNNIYQVQVYRGREADELVHIEAMKGRCTWLSIKRKDKRPVNNWQDMQTIKNRLVGVERDAFQIFPAESRMVNTANQYHLIVLPEGQALPFGWVNGRTVLTKDVENEAGPSQSYRGER